MRKFLLLLLALVWGYAVYGIHQDLGYNKLNGPPPVPASLFWAYCAAMPLFVGAWVGGENYPSQKFHHWSCAVLLFIQFIFSGFLILLIPLALAPFTFIPLIGLGLILYPYTPEATKTAPLDTQTIRRLAMTVLILVGAFYGLHYFRLHHKLLPSDEVMIAHFHQYRPEIEEMVRRYGECEMEILGGSCELLPENQALMKKAGVRRVVDSGPAWFPNPYSKEASKQFHDLLRTGKIPSLNAYKNITVEMLDTKHPARSYTSVLTPSGGFLVFKRLVFMPAVVRIKDGHLLLPAHPFCGITHKDRIFPSLNEYPPNWKKGECVYRQIETHWFIEMCTAVV